MARGRQVFEVPTLLMMGLTYLVWALGTTLAWTAFPPLGWVLTGLAIAQFSSLQHEVLHGHPFADRRINEALVFPGLTLFVPFQRFRDLHLAHHYDPDLTDPYDDPETNYLDPAAWTRMSRVGRALYRFNNTLMGRILIGPALSIRALIRDDLALIRAGDREVRRAWVLQAYGVGLVLVWLWGPGMMPVWAYLLAAYAGFGLLKIRTFLEHRAHEASRARTVIVEDRGPLALLFLNNNLHAVHHAHPGLAWYELPGRYAANRAQFLRRNDGYVYRNYAEVFRQYSLTAKDPVPHPLWSPKPKVDQSILRNVGTEPELSKNGTPG